MSTPISTSSPQYYLAYKTEKNCFKHSKINVESVDLAPLFKKYDGSIDNTDLELANLTSTLTAATSTLTAANAPFDDTDKIIPDASIKTAVSIYILQKTVDAADNKSCINIRKLTTTESNYFEYLINQKQGPNQILINELKNVTDAAITKANASAGGGITQKKRKTNGGSTMKNKIKPKHKYNYKNKPKSTTRKN